MMGRIFGWKIKMKTCVGWWCVLLLILEPYNMAFLHGIMCVTSLCLFDGLFAILLLTRAPQMQGRKIVGSKQVSEQDSGE